MNEVGSKNKPRRSDRAERKSKPQAGRTEVKRSDDVNLRAKRTTTKRTIGTKWKRERSGLFTKVKR